jgi:transcriptional regulator with XRE-family HTH domain
MQTQDNLTVLDNKAIGRNISMYRKIRDIKAFDIANRLGMKEAAYTKYERGETQITIEFVQKVAEVLNIDPLQILTVSPNTILENISNSSIAIQDHSTFQTSNEQQAQMMLKLMESVTVLNERLVTLLEKKEN